MSLQNGNGFFFHSFAGLVEFQITWHSALSAMLSRMTECQSPPAGESDVSVRVLTSNKEIVITPDGSS